MEITKILSDTENGIRTDDDDDYVFFKKGADSAKRKQVVFKNHNGEHFLYSYVNGEVDGVAFNETYVFPFDDETGETTRWHELFSVDGYMSVEDVMEEMEIGEAMSEHSSEDDVEISKRRNNNE